MNYAYLENPTAFLTSVPERVSPFNLSGNFSEYRLIDWEVSQWYKSQLVLNPRSFVEQSTNLLPGIFNLINFLIEKYAQSETIQTLLFLDKSARLGAFFFQQAVTEAIELARLQKHDLSYLKKIQLRFIVPQENQVHSPSTITSLRKRYRQLDFNDRVMIIDEFILSGRSVRNAIKLLLLGNYTPTQIEALSIFERAPMWYSTDSVKGVADDTGTSEESRKFVINLTTNERALFLGAIKKFGWEQLTQLLMERKNNQQIQARIGNEIEELFDLLPSNSSPDQVVRYLASEEGTLAIPPRKIDVRATKTYRQALGLVIKEVFKQKLIEYRP